MDKPRTRKNQKQRTRDPLRKKLTRLKQMPNFRRKKSVVRDVLVKSAHQLVAAKSTFSASGMACK
jgi:hypothetical protein